MTKSTKSASLQNRSGSEMLLLHYDAVQGLQLDCGELTTSGIVPPSSLTVKTVLRITKVVIHLSRIVSRS